MEVLQSLFGVEWALDFRYTTCIDVKISMAKTPWNFALRDGKMMSSRILDGRTCHFMEALDFVLAVSSFHELKYKRTSILIELERILP